MAQESEFERESRRRAELRSIGQKQLDLEASLGLTEKMERAREGRFIPLGIDGERVSPDEYFADEYDARREGVRAAYFEVADVEKRRRLIDLQLELEAAIEQQSEARFRERQHAVKQARQVLERLPWEVAGLVAVGCVIAGYYFQGTVGAIGGAVAGLFLGQAIIANRRADRAAELAQAEEDLDAFKKDARIAALSPAYFNELEAATGEEDGDFGRECARWNVARHEREQKKRELEG